jgi:hypothetical protein
MTNNNDYYQRWLDGEIGDSELNRLQQNKGRQMKTFSIELLCSECEAVLDPTDHWSGLCHDCDNQMEYDED